MCKISIIIPVYNRGFCIGECIESVQRQSINDLQIICVDDGSTDDTVDRINEYAANDQRINLYSIEHSGPGAARNYGIKKAKGAYISFLDSDDRYLDRDSLKTLVDVAEKDHVDVCGSRIYRFTDGRSILHNPFVYRSNFSRDGTLINFPDVQNPYDYTGFIYKREFLIHNNLFFPDYLRCEDPVFQARALHCAGQYLMLPVRLYEIHTVSDKRSDEWNARYSLDAVRGIKDLISIADEYDYHTLHDLAEEYIKENYNNIIKNADEECMTILDELGFSSAPDQEEAVSGTFMYHINRCPGLLSCIEKYFLDRQINTILIYGAGKYGATFNNMLSQTTIKIVGVIDRKVDSFKELPVYRPDDIFPEVEAILITTRYSDGIREQLESKVSTEILNAFVMLDEIRKSM